jgi:hypothetical protein
MKGQPILATFFNRKKEGVIETLVGHDAKGIFDFGCRRDSTGKE